MCKNVVPNERKTELFQKYFSVPFSLISDKVLQGEVWRVLSCSPDYFWTKGYYHMQAPLDEKEPCGMIRRIAKDCYFVQGLLETWQLTEYSDIAIAACLLHDCVKFGISEDQPVQKKFHGPATVEWISSILPGSSDAMNNVLATIARHDGWAFTDGAIPLLAKKENMLDCDWVALTIHTADMISSRPTTSFTW